MPDLSPRWRRTGPAALALLAGCGLLDPGGVEISVRLSEATVAPGSSIELEVVVTNLSARPIETSRDVCPSPFEILDGDELAVGPGSRPCPLALIGPVPLEPGESFTRSYEWRGDGLDGDVLPPGLYLLRAWADVVGGDRVYGRDQQVLVQ